jgi:RNA polymerase sigma-70 factor, ECF subfamily
LDELELVEGLKQRRDDAVREYLQRYRSLFFHCIGHFETDALRREELFSELAWHAIQRLEGDSFDPQRGSFGTWLYRVAWCRSVDLKRQQNARRRVNLTTGLEELPEHPDPSPDPGTEAGDAEIGERVRAALSELDPEARELIELRHANGLMMADVAERLGISLEQAKYRLKRATSAMRHALLAHLPREEVLE